MATERFDIEVRDLVAKTIRTELRAIGAEARTTHGIIQQLNAGVRAAAAGAQIAASQATQAAARTAAAQARSTAESARATAQTARLSSEQTKAGLSAQRLAEAEARTALAKQRLATEAARTAAAQSKANVAYLAEEAALNRAVAAEARAIASKDRLAAASAREASAAERTIRITPGRVEPGSGTNIGARVGSRSASERAVDIMRGGGVPPATQEVEENTSALGANRAAAAAAARAQADFGAHTSAAGNAAGFQARHMHNLIFQLNDVIVSLMSGQKPIMVLIQQGSQIGQIGMQAGIGWKQLSREMLGAMRIIETVTNAEAAAELAAASGAAARVQASVAVAAAKVMEADTEIALALAQREGAVTAAQVAAAEARLAGAHEAAAAAAIEQAIAERALATAMGRQEEAASNASKLTTTRLGSVGRAAAPLATVLVLAAAGIAAVNHEANNDTDMKKYARSLGLTAKEMRHMHDLTITYGDTAKAVFQVGIRRIARQLGIDTDSIAKTWNNMLDFMARNTRRVLAGLYAMWAGVGYGIRNIVRNIGDGKSNDNPFKNVVKGYKDAYADAQSFFDDVASQSATNARSRIRAEAEKRGYLDPEKGKTPRKDSSGFDRAKELRDINNELDSQIRLLQFYGEELERNTQLEQIAKRFREEGVPLTAAETAALMTKITTIQMGLRVQQAMTAADEAANGAERTYSATQEALNNLLTAGAIDHAEYNRQLRLSQRAFEDATDPLAALNRELERNGELVGRYGRDRSLREYIQSLETAAEAQGRTIYQTGQGAANDNGDIVVTGSKRYTPDAQRMIDEYRRQQEAEKLTSAFEAIDPREHEDPTGSAYILDNYRRMYDEIQRFREQDVRNEEEAAHRKQNLDRAVSDARLETASQMFGQLTALQNSNIREVAAIGKAAAIAQATIDGIRAVQAALAGPPGPPWSFAIAGVTAAMTAVNVAKIAGIGFQRGGYTGDGHAGDVAGPAHRGEYVFDAFATRRIGIPALEALRTGNVAPQIAANDAPRRAVIRIVQGPGTYIEAVERSDGEIEIIAERVARQVAPKAVADDIRQPNSRTSKAVAGAFGLGRKR